MRKKTINSCVQMDGKSVEKTIYGKMAGVRYRQDSGNSGCLWVVGLQEIVFSAS